MYVRCSEGNVSEIICQWCNYIYKPGDDESQIAFSRGTFTHIGCKNICLICNTVIESIFKKDENGVFHKTCFNNIRGTSRCPKHERSVQLNLNIFWPVADLINNYKRFPREYRAYMLEQYKILRIGLRLPKLVVYCIIEHAVYPYGYATKIQNGIDVDKLCTNMCSFPKDFCRCGDYVGYLENYSAKCKNGVCKFVPCEKCCCNDCGYTCIREYSYAFMEKNIKPIYASLKNCFAHLIINNPNAHQLYRQLAHLVKTNFNLIPHETKLTLINTLFSL